MYTPHSLTMTLNGFPTFDFQRGKVTFVAGQTYGSCSLFSRAAVICFALQNTPRPGTVDVEQAKPPTIILLNSVSSDNEINGTINKLLEGSAIHSGSAVPTLNDNGFQFKAFTFADKHLNADSHFNSVADMILGISLTHDIQGLILDGMEFAMMQPFTDHGFEQSRNSLEWVCKHLNIACMVTTQLKPDAGVLMSAELLRDQPTALERLEPTYLKGYPRVLLDIKEGQDGDDIFHYAFVAEDDVIMRGGSCIAELNHRFPVFEIPARHEVA